MLTYHGVQAGLMAIKIVTASACAGLPGGGTHVWSGRSSASSPSAITGDRVILCPR